MAGEDSTPCRHPGAPPDDIIDLVVNAIKSISTDSAFLQQCGLTKQDFELALPAAIQRFRGSFAATNTDRRQFLTQLFSKMVELGSIHNFETPDYGDDTVYKLQIAGIGNVAIIQKGCPDGKHSSVNWSSPKWADETYLWWLCDSLQYEPGEHVSKGISRLRKRFFSSDYVDSVDGVIFHNATCGSPLRPCPKIHRAIGVGDSSVPPPCIWVMPARDKFDDTEKTSWNWTGERNLLFPKTLLSVFGIEPHEASLFTGHVGFLKTNSGARTTISSRFGPGASTTYRSNRR